MFREEILKEMSIAGYGDWEPSKEMVGTIGKIVVDKHWKQVGNLKIDNIEYLIFHLEDTYLAGNFMTSSEGDEKLEVDFEIRLREHKSTAVSFKLRQKLMNVDGVKVAKTKQARGIATEMYKFLLKEEKYIILGDEIQYFGARKLWARLSKSLDVIVDIIDINTDEYLEKDVTLKHGSNDWEFDNRVWDYDTHKKHIRLFLKDIKG